MSVDEIFQKEIVAEDSPRQKLVRACREGNLDMVKQLCENGYPFEENIEPNIPLHEACWYVKIKANNTHIG